MHTLLIAAIAAHAFVGGSCDIYPVLVPGDTAEDTLMSKMVPPTCATDIEDELATETAGPCTGGQCIDVMPDKESGLDIGLMPLVVIDLPSATLSVKKPELHSNIPVVSAGALSPETHTETTVWLC